MTPKEFAEVASAIAKSGMTVEEANIGMNKMSEAFYEVMIKEIKAMAKERGITFEDAEVLYLKRLGRLSGKRGKMAQRYTLTKVRKFGRFDY